MQCATFGSQDHSRQELLLPFLLLAATFLLLAAWFNNKRFGFYFFRAGDLRAYACVCICKRKATTKSLSVSLLFSFPTHRCGMVFWVSLHINACLRIAAAFRISGSPTIYYQMLDCCTSKLLFLLRAAGVKTSETQPSTPISRILRRHAK